MEYIIALKNLKMSIFTTFISFDYIPTNKEIQLIYDLLTLNLLQFLV